MQAVILAGGFGTRLSHIVKDVPKPMAPIADIPFLKYQYDLFSSQGVDNFIFLTGYKSEVIEAYFDSYPNIKFIKEDHPLGTGGAVLNAFKYLEDDFLLVNGDTFFDIDLSILDKFSKDKPISMSLRFTDNIKRYGFVSLKDQSSFLVNEFIEKGELPSKCIDGFINGGIYQIKKNVLAEFYDSFKDEMISFETDILPTLVNNQKVYGLPLGGVFIDIGIPEDYYTAQTLIPNWIKKDKKPALFLDKDGTLIQDEGYSHGPNIQLIERTFNLVKEYSDKGYYIVMITNQAGVAKQKFELSQMFENIEAVKKQYLLKGVSFDDIQYCCYHEKALDNSLRYVSLLRKPSPGMLLKVSEKLKIDMSNSVMVGDNMEVDKINLPYLKSIILNNR